jgi:hypothetical protein
VLFIAVSRNYTEVVKILIESGTDINIEDGKNWNALDGVIVRDNKRSTRQRV